ncbi:MAG: phage terminase small subunit [Clostridia bacterium]|jgi:uncharacterized protein YjcR|nr:phage terminase small subunit [Clostridia bacterium]
MPRPRSPNRDAAQNDWIESHGKLTTKELAEKYKVSESKIRKWKSVDKWTEKLKEKYPNKKGAQPGNKNSKGHGAPKRNQNAKKHGAYCTVFLDDLTEEETNLKDSLTDSVPDNLMLEFQTLMIKQMRLKKAIAALDSAEEGRLYVDTVTVMETPKSAKEKEADKVQEAADVAEEYYIEDADVYVSKKSASGEKLHMRITNNSSAFNRKMKLEEVLIKTHGRIIKVLEAMRTYEMELKRLSLEESKLTLAKWKLTGEINTTDDDLEVIDDWDDKKLLLSDEDT